MKICLVLFLGFLISLYVGWFAGYSHPINIKTRQAMQYVNKAEPEFSGTAIYALATIPLIQAGDTNAAIELLSHPIADYYCLYANNPGTNRYRITMRENIDKMARSNAIVAASIQQALNRYRK